MNMMRLGDIDNFDKIEKIAENVERKKQMKNVELSEEDKNRISEWISDCKGGLESAKKLTGFSVNYLSALKNKHRDRVRGSTYEVFNNILNPEPSPSAEKESVIQQAYVEYGNGEPVDKVKELFRCRDCGTIEETDKDGWECCGMPMEKVELWESKPQNEFEVMNSIDKLLNSLSDDETRRVINYFEMKYNLRDY